METLVAPVLACFISVFYGTAKLNETKKVIADQKVRIELLEETIVKVEADVDKRMDDFDMAIGTKMVRVITPVAQATKRLQEAVGMG